MLYVNFNLQKRDWYLQSLLFSGWSLADKYGKMRGHWLRYNEEKATDETRITGNLCAVASFSKTISWEN